MFTTLPSPTLQFDLPPELEAGQPPEARGLARDQVKMMVSHYRDDRVFHTRFDQIAHYLQAGDVVVINTSGTMNAALPVQRADGTPLELHLSTRLPADVWSVELRRPRGHSTTPFFDGRVGEQLALPGGGLVTLLTPHNPAQRLTSPWQSVFLTNHRIRLWLAVLQLPLPLGDYLQQHGFPIRYSYVADAWPISYYQTVYANEIGSAEMPSAGCAFTPELITQLVAKGVQVLPLILRTGSDGDDREPGPAARQTHHRRRHPCHPRPGKRHRQRRHGPRGHGLDRCGHHPPTWHPRREWAAHRLARTGSHPPGDAGNVVWPCPPAPHLPASPRLPLPLA